MLTQEQHDEIEALWNDNAHAMGFAVSDGLSAEAFAQGYALAMGWDW